MNVIKTLALPLLLGLSAPAFSKKIQIIHTNDLHSYFQGTRGGLGGYAQLKKVLDDLRQEADAQGIETLHLDGGDFGEGSSFYFSNEGVDSLRALDLLGIDVTVLGNHDFILGGRELRNQMIKADFKGKMVSANLQGKRFMGLRRLVKDYVDYDIDGKKVRIFGLTTNEIHFMYPLRPLGFISNPIKAGIKQAQRAQKDGVDFLIALTHLGLHHDINLVRSTFSVDLVVGGHSHIKLSRPELTRNLRDRPVPILQAGAHGGHVGSLIIDVKSNGQSELIDYKMIDVLNDMPQDEVVRAFVDESYQARENYFGGRKWDEVIGLTEIPLSGNYNGNDAPSRTCWSQHIARLTREVAKTELGLQFDVFQGEMIPPGQVTFGDIIDNFPHFRRWGDKGWTLARAHVSGFLLRKILDTLANSEVALQVTIDGLKVKDKNKDAPFDLSVHNSDSAMIAGENIQNMRFYSIGLPSEIPHGVEKLLNVFGRLLLKNLKYLPEANYWDLMEEYIKKNSPLRCLED